MQSFGPPWYSTAASNTAISAAAYVAIPVQPSATLLTDASLTASLGPRLSDTMRQTAGYSLEPWKQIFGQHLLSGYSPSPCLINDYYAPIPSMPALALVAFFSS